MNSSIVVDPRYYVFIPEEGEDSSSPSGKESSSSGTQAETVVSSDLVEQVELTNHLLVGIILFIGVFFGAFCMAHLFNRIRKD